MTARAGLRPPGRGGAPGRALAQALDPALYADADTFGAAVVGRALVPVLYSDADAFFTPSIAVGPVTVSPALYADADVFSAPSLAERMLPALLADADVFLAPTVARRLAPPLLVDADSFSAAAVTYTSTLLPALFGDPLDMVITPVFSKTGDYVLLGLLYLDADAFYTPSVAAGPITLQPVLLAEEAIFPPSLQATYALVPQAYSDADTVYAVVARSDYHLLPSAYADADVVFSSTVFSAPVIVSPQLFADPDVFYEATRRTLKAPRRNTCIRGQSRVINIGAG